MYVFVCNQSFIDPKRARLSGEGENSKPLWVQLPWERLRNPYIYICVCMYVYIDIYIYIHICICVCIHVNMYECIYIWYIHRIYTYFIMIPAGLGQLMMEWTPWPDKLTTRRTPQWCSLVYKFINLIYRIYIMCGEVIAFAKHK